MNRSLPRISPAFAWSAGIRTALLCLGLATPVQGQGFLEQFSYEGLRLTGIGVEFGAVGSDRLTTEPSGGLRLDWGLIAPRVRVMIGGSYFRGRFEAAEIAAFESSLRRVVTDPTQDFTIDVGDITWATLQADLDLQYLFPAGRVITYLGLGLGLNLRDGDGVAVAGTFVEDALDTVEAGLNLSLGWMVRLVPYLHLTLDLRGSLASELRTAAGRAGLMVRFPRGGPAAR